MTFQQPRLLPDEPVIADSFGAHERIANALAALIDSSEGGKSIRLDGDWGAGKSTVVQILRKRLSNNQASQKEKNPRTRIFVYDAWVHSGDGLRRAFFESLVRDLRSCEWIRPESTEAKLWEQKLSSMAGRSKRVTKLSWPRFSPGARVAMALSVTGALFSPAVYSLLAKALQDSPSWLLWSLTGCGAVVLFFIVLGISAPNLRILLTKSTLDETTETLTDPEPTSIEFQEQFEHLMQSTLSPHQHSSRKLVIVVDNLDRIEPDEAQQVWALLRSFLDNPTFRESEWFKRLWLLVPMANESRLSKFGGTNGMNSSQGKGNTLEKVFQVRMSLPLPMLQSWKGFLAEKLEYCFGVDVDGSHEVIARLLHATTSVATPTPRQIVVFVNELVALYTERQGDMSLSTLAAYILSQGKERAQPWQVPVEISKVLYYETMEQDFATLYLHASKSVESLYLLILPNLQRALEMGAPEELHKVLQRSPAAQDILDQYLINCFSRMSQSHAEAQKEQALFFALLRALVMFTEPALSSQSSTGFLVHIRPRIDRVMELTTSLELSNPNVAAGVEAYFALSGSDRFAAAKVNSLLQTISAIPETNSPVAPGAWDVWTRSLIEILSVEKVRTSTDILDGQRLSLPVPVERWADICAELEADPSRSFALDMLDVSTNSDKLADWIVTESLPMNVDHRAVRVLKQGMHARGAGFFQLVAKKIGEIIRARSDIPRAEVLACLECLVEASNEQARPFLKELVSEGKFFLWARNNQASLSFTFDETFIRFSLLYIWAQGGLAENPSTNGTEALSNIIRNLLQGKTTVSNLVVNTSNELILRTRIYDVLPIIAGIVAGMHGVLHQMLLRLCDNAKFLEIARMELNEEGNASAARLLIGQGAEVIRKLVLESIERQQASSFTH